jgi:1-deoxy-D-xylulose-5-phosphate synthase
VGKFDKITGKPAPKNASRPAYTKVFGDTMLELAAKDKRVVAITAAMATGTGLDKFAREYPERFYDVGIAEGHAGCFAGGLAAAGARPYMAVYSTFMQRAYDQVIHDVALQKLPVVFCMDRAGLVGADGPTHHGAFDLSYLSPVPNLVVAVPKDGNELRAMMHYTIDHVLDGPVAIRYPRASVPTEMEETVAAIEWGKWETLTSDADVVLMASGSMVTTALEVREKLAGQLEVAVVNARFLRPLDLELLERVCDASDLIVTLEENVIRGGLGQAVGAYLAEHGYGGGFKPLAIPDRFVTHGDRPSLLKEIGLDTASVASAVESLARVHTNRKEEGGFLHKLRFRRNGSSRKRPELSSTTAVSTEDKG